MATKTDIANLALGLLGEFQIGALTDTTKQARLCNRFIDQVILEELRSHTWNRSIKRAALAQLSDAPAFGYKYYYSLPTDFLRIVRVNDGKDYNEYRIEGNKVLSDEANINLLYVFNPFADEDVGGTGLLDPLCIEAIYYRLAIKLAIPLSDDVQLRNELKIYYINEVIPNARYVDSIEKDERIDDDSSWINSRQASTNG